MTDTGWRLSKGSEAGEADRYRRCLFHRITVCACGASSQCGLPTQGQSRDIMIVVGSSGEVGRLLVTHWRRASTPVVLQYRNNDAPDPQVFSLRWDPDGGVTALADWIEAHDIPSAMLVLAGVTPRSGRDLTLNTHIAETCLAAAKEVGIERVLVASSSAVYGDELDRPFRETDATRPVNEYGAAKLEMEQACVRWSSALEVVCLRIGNVAGADALLRQAYLPERPEILLDRFADGTTPLRSYIGPGTMAAVLTGLATHDGPLPSALNLAAPRPVEMGALADAAGLPWRPRNRSDTKGQSITLECAQLWGLLEEPERASEPPEMIAQINLSRTKP